MEAPCWGTESSRSLSVQRGPEPPPKILRLHIGMSVGNTKNHFLPWEPLVLGKLPMPILGKFSKIRTEEQEKH